MKTEFGKVLIKAANKIQNGSHRFTCHAIDYCDPNSDFGRGKVVDFYRDLMKPSDEASLVPVDFGDVHGYDFKEPEVINFRVLALCMAAAVAEGGGL